jgi:hypothetical protein
MIGSSTTSSTSYLTPLVYGLSGAGSSTSNPIASGATFGETQAAIDDSGNEGIVLSLGGAPQGSSVYDAAGLLNSFVQAGTGMSDASSVIPSNSIDGSGLAPGALSGNAMLLGTQDSISLPGTSSAVDQQSLWVSTLQTNPSMSATVASDALDQGLVSTLSVVA